eukprot:gb/GECH01013896.1/.p1 GENE.gb/GECH01013896.1/~~gb/GECH01013896.1/.p1  ORF type:complete len:491 (+),score=112.54 gb/GECH01013896.1/:1-1473(+)
MDFIQVDDIPPLFNSLNKKFLSGKTRKYEWRISMLKNLKAMLKEPELKEAVKKDLRQVDFFIKLQFGAIENEINNAISNLSSWMKPERKPVLAAAAPASGYTIREPYGVTLIIGAWNYPVELVVRPLIGALAAGNCVVLKPSEVSEHSSIAFAKLIPKYLDSECIQVVEGGVTETTALLKQPWHYIFYTGNPHVGKIIMRAASEHLTPVTLELGGKNPVFVDEHANIPVAAKRIMWGKFMTLGQVCIAPDYMLLHRSIAKKFKQECIKVIKEFYGDNPQESEYLARIINERHTRRIGDMIDNLSQHEKIITGGNYDIKDRFVAPTLVDNVDFDSILMKDEIFGPILPIIEYDNIDDVIEYVNSRNKPLCISVFSESKNTRNKILNSTSSGSCLINELMVLFVCYQLPFGGVNTSGMGKYGGKRTFDLFSNEKAVMEQTSLIDVPIRYPPFTKTKASLGEFATFNVDLYKYLWVLVVPLIAFTVSWIFMQN